MAAIEPTLFSWQDVEARSDLDRFILVRDPEATYAVPSGWNCSRFLSNVIELEESLGLVTGIIEMLRE